MSDHLSIKRGILLWVLFFMICFGLGYPILNRYDPGKIPGTSDAAGYSEQLKGPVTLSNRMLVPALGKPFYLLADGRIGTWDPALFGLLVASSILTAGTAIVIIAIGLRYHLSFTTALVGSMLFVLDFAVPNWGLSGYVDSGEAFFLALVVWSLLSDRWFLLPLWAIPGSLAKNTFAPFAVSMVVIWWLSERPLRWSRFAWTGGLAAVSAGVVAVSLRAADGVVSGVADYTRYMGIYKNIGFLHAVLRCVTAHEILFTFAWLLPLGLLRIRQMDRRWVWASAGACFVALLLGAYNDAQGNTARPLFNIAGPLLSLAAARFLTSGTKDEKASTA